MPEGAIRSRVSEPLEEPVELFKTRPPSELLLCLPSAAHSAAGHEQAHPRRLVRDNDEARAAAACATARRGQLSRARQVLTAAA